MDQPNVALLVIDDNLDNLELLQAALEQRGLEILTADRPQRGLELIQERRPEIVLTDLMMPGMTGMEVLEHTKQHHPGTEVILMTAYYSAESAAEATRKGACDYLEKPLSIMELRRKVKGLIKQAQDRQTHS